MDYGLTGRLAVVTGASSGLGLAIAETLAGEGCRLILFSRTQEKLSTAAAKITAQYGAEAQAVAGDMTSARDVERLADETERAGGADVLVINTGRPPVPMREVLDETDEQRWRDAFETQLWGGIKVISALVPPMVLRRRGRVVAVTSATVKQPMTMHGLSTVFRVGLAGYLKHLANEVAKSGVTVNSVCPASIGTLGLLATYDPKMRAAQVPLGRLGTPQELAAAVAFLASEQAGFITGASLQVDGGQVASLT